MFLASSPYIKYIEGLSRRLYAYPLLIGVLLGLLLLIFSPFLMGLFRRVGLSWFYGIWRVSPTAVFLVIVFDLFHSRFSFRRVTILGITTIVVDYLPFYFAQLRKLRTIKPEEVLLRRVTLPRLRRRRRYADDPISEWSQDLLHRSSLVDGLR